MTDKLSHFDDAGQAHMVDVGAKAGTRQWIEFVGGVLVGLGLGVFVFLAMALVWMHHMFIMGVSSWPALIATLAVPVLLIVIGFGLALLQQRKRRETVRVLLR